MQYISISSAVLDGLDDELEIWTKSKNHHGGSKGDSWWERSCEANRTVGLKISEVAAVLCKPTSMLLPRNQLLKWGHSSLEWEVRSSDGINRETGAGNPVQGFSPQPCWQFGLDKSLLWGWGCGACLVLCRLFSSYLWPLPARCQQYPLPSVVTNCLQILKMSQDGRWEWSGENWHRIAPDWEPPI